MLLNPYSHHCRGNPLDKTIQELDLPDGSELDLPALPPAPRPIRSGLIMQLGQLSQTRNRCFIDRPFYPLEDLQQCRHFMRGQIWSNDRVPATA